MLENCSVLQKSYRFMTNATKEYKKDSKRDKALMTSIVEVTHAI